MFELFEELITSQWVMFLILGGVMLAMTSYAFRNKEQAGYALGWLVGILMIIIIQSITGGTSTGAEAPETRVTFRSLNGSLVVTLSLMGIIAGYGSLFFMDAFQRTHRRRAVSVAIGTCLLVVAMYFVLGLSDEASYFIGLFALGFTIGALSNRVLDSTPVPTRQFTQERLDNVRSQSIQQPQAQQAHDVRPTANYDARQAPPPATNMDEQAERFNRLRRPDQRR